MTDSIKKLQREAAGLPPLPRPIPVRLPDLPVVEGGGSAANDERMAILSQSREIIERAFQEAGYRLIGSGFGMRDDAYGETDIGLEYAGHKIEIRAFLPKR